MVQSKLEHFESQCYVIIDSARCPGRPLVYNPNSHDVDSEDCLTANVFRPKGATGANSKLPVGVYIHGGAFNRGTSSMHDSASMVGWSDEHFIIVSFNYRIGALAFLNSALTAKDGLLNIGLKDQILLLEWVQENIHEFGGDPDNVTIFGLSAGAHSVSVVTNLDSIRALLTAKRLATMSQTSTPRRHSSTRPSSNLEA